MRMRMVDYRENKMRSVVTNLCVAVITFATGIAASWALIPVRKPPLTLPHLEVNYDTAEAGTLKRTIQDAKARGENKVEIQVLACGSYIGNLQQALSRDTIVLADLLEKKTYADTYGLRTWYRLKIKETLVEHAPPHLAYSPFPTAPSDMLPIAEDEFLIVEANGWMEIDGVTVIQHSNGAWYLEGQTYLLFLWLDPSKRTAMRTGTDPLGVFLVDNDGTLSPYVNQPYPLRSELAKRFNNSTNELRRVLKKTGSHKP